MADLKRDSFYWVRYAEMKFDEDGRTLVPSSELSEPQPARFTGLSGGSPPIPTWDFIGKPSPEEMAIVQWIGPEIAYNIETDDDFRQRLKRNASLFDSHVPLVETASGHDLDILAGFYKFFRKVGMDIKVS